MSLKNSLFYKYINEYYGAEIVENDVGFITYYIKDNMCVIDDLYVLPEYRRFKVADELAQNVEKIARLNKCIFLEAEAFLDCKTFKESTGAMHYFGFRKVSEDKERRCELWRKDLEYV